jgi:hypothetical protein
MIPLILALLPAVPNIVLGIEHMFGHGNGTTKKQTAMSILGDLVNAFTSAGGSAVPGANSSEMELIDELIEATVKYLNATGAMVHGS